MEVESLGRTLLHRGVMQYRDLSCLKKYGKPIIMRLIFPINEARCEKTF